VARLNLFSLDIPAMLEWTLWLTMAALGYVYVGYPLLMACVGHFSRQSRGKAGYEPSVSLLIPAYNEAEVIREKLTNALAIDYPRQKLEVLVGSDCSSDDTVSIARSFTSKGVQVWAFSSRRGKASVLNDLVPAARGEILVLCDANVMFARDALRHLIDRLNDPQIGAVTGDVRLKSEDCSFGAGEGLYYALERRVQLGESAVGSVMGVDGGMYVIRKELFAPLSPDTILDDFVISMRVIQHGRRVVYEPLAVAHENATPSARSEFRRRVRVSAGAIQSIVRGHWPPYWRPIELWQYFSHKLLRWSVPLLLIVLLVLSASLLQASLIYRFLFGVQLAAYSLAAAGAISVRIRQTRLGGVVFYFVMTFVAMLTGTVKGLFFRQSGAWTKTARKAGAS
jgi:cellulose synthase/poly-beta-1,6-N-acetylglucosamine synthase-like glycosyltransferase